MRSSNSYRFVWNDAAINRDTNSLVTASIELFRNDDAFITTNGVAAHLPRELPFEHHGYGQDAEWVTANFTNATEILSVGYPQWVDAQVGTSLTNGLYKLTVNVADDPPETTQISVGNLSIAVTNAGEYVFLLGKGIRYDLSASSECATNFEYCAVDDIVCHTRLAAGGLRLQGDGGQEGVWSSDSGELRLFWPFEFVEWKPTLSISPRKWNPSRANAVRSFTATLTDIPWFVSPSYTWSSADSSVCTCDGAQDRTATFTCKFPAAYGSGVSLALDMMLNRTTLHADYWRYIGYFANPSLSNLLDHGLHGANSWVEVKANNRAGSDTACPGALYPPFSDGSFTWPIPNHWRMKGDRGIGKWFCNDDQHFAITSNGTTSVWKFGKKGVRILNSNILTVTDEAIP